MDLALLANKACHNCRRRRLKCDRCTPRCQKCTKTGQECLGYGKLFLWNQGVASRGKMMGKSFNAADTPAPPRDSLRKDAAGEAAAAQRRGADEPPAKRQKTVPAADEGVEMTAMAIRPSLIDPLFQDLDRTSRFYIAHYTSKLCQDFVTYDLPDRNPFRSLVALTSENEILQHIIVANAAIHMSNIQSLQTRSASTIAALPFSVSPVGRTSNHQQLSLSSPVNNVPSDQRSLQHALVAKQKALKLLQQALQNPDPANSEVTLASVLLFINFELLYSGKEDWKVHVDGARRLIECFESSNGVAESSAMSRLRDYVVSDCLIYYVLGSTVTFSRPKTGPLNPPLEVLPMLRRAEANSYMACPAVLLQTMLSASHLANSDIEEHQQQDADQGQQSPCSSDAIQQRAAQLMQQAQSFDVVAWAHSVQHIISPINDVEVRIHLASAHKAAVCLYIHRAAPGARLLDEGARVEELVREIVRHISCIGFDEPLVKGTSWPTFIAGAESRDPERQAWSVTRLHALWELLPWGYVPTAIEMLGVIWGVDDPSGGADEGGGGGGVVSAGWLHKLKTLGIDWIVV